MAPTDQAKRLAGIVGAMRLGRELIGHDRWTVEQLKALQRRRPAPTHDLPDGGQHRHRPVPGPAAGGGHAAAGQVELRDNLQDERDTAGKFKLVESRLSRPAARVP
jgi:hypothetical protein